jgi:hypothetical protein
MTASINDEAASSSLESSRDMLVRPGLSVHVYPGVVGIYSNRIDSGRGFVELPSADFLALLEFFTRSDRLDMVAGEVAVLEYGGRR